MDADRQQIRAFYHTAWAKKQQQQPLTALESMVADVIAEHPEYHAFFDQPADTAEVDENDVHSNPYLHLGLHIALAEQLQTDRPAGIRALYQQICQRFDNRQQAEHRIIDCLQAQLWEAQQQGRAPDEQAYLNALKQLATTR